MMNKKVTSLSRSKHTDLVYLIKSSAYPWLYSKLVQILSEDEIRYFASVEMRQTEGRWSAFHEGNFVSYVKISKADKEFIADDLNYLHTVVRRKIADDSDMTEYVKYLLVIPSQEQIFVYHDESESPKITLAQWGCALPRSKQGYDPLGLILEEKKKTHIAADLAVKWTTGEPAANVAFKFSYKYSILKKTTDKNGLAHLGLLKLGATFTISDIIELPAFEKIFDVVPEQNLYTIAIPYYTSVEIKVIDQLKQPVAGCEMRAIHNDDDRTYLTNEQGKFRIDKILHDKNPLILSLMPDNKINKEYILEREHNKLVFNIHRIITASVRITLINKFDNKPVASHTVKVKTADGEEKEFASDSEGIVLLNRLETPTVITVTDAADKYNYRDFAVDVNGGEFVFPLELPVIITPNIKVINRKDKTPVGAYPLKVKIGDNEQKLHSNREGVIALAGVEQGGKILVTDANDCYNNAEFTVDINNAELIFPVELPEIMELRIKVVNRNDEEPVGAYPLKVKIGNNEQEELFSNRDGIILLNLLEKDAKLSIVDGNNPYNNVEFTIDAGMVEYIFPIELPEKKMVKIKLVTKRKEVVPNHIIDVIINGEHHKKTTDSEGKISLPASLFTHGQKVKVEVPITENDMNIIKRKKRNKNNENNN
jgi:hypothetical protein